MIKSLTGWRGIFVMCIVGYHEHIKLFSQSNVGVSFFFVVSGFLIALKYDRKPITLAAYWNKMKQRLAKLLPVHWLALACILFFNIVMQHKVIDWKILLTHIFLVQSWIPNVDYYFTLNSVSWFIGNLIFCYLCWPLLARVFVHLRTRWQVAIIAAWWVIAIVVQDPSIRIYTYVSPLTRLGDFVLGIAAASVVKTMPKPRLNANVMEIAVVVTIIVFAVLNTYTPLRKWEDFLSWWPAVVMLIMVFYWTDKQPGIVGKFLQTAPMQWLGKVSLEIYLFQYVSMFFVNHFVAPVFGHFGIMVYDCNAVFSVPLLLVIAWGVYRLRTKFTPSFSTPANPARP